MKNMILASYRNNFAAGRKPSLRRYREGWLHDNFIRFSGHNWQADAEWCQFGPEHTGGKLGDRDAEVIFVDDQRKPDVAKQLANRLIKRDKVDVVAGVIWSNLLMAIHKQVTRSDTLLISSNAGPSPLAGEKCHKNFVSMSWQNDQTAEGMGKYMQDAGIKSVYMLAPNYQAGKDMLTVLSDISKAKLLAKFTPSLVKVIFRLNVSVAFSQTRSNIYISTWWYGCELCEAVEPEQYGFSQQALFCICC